jgi:hypothetical protein
MQGRRLRRVSFGGFKVSRFKNSLGAPSFQFYFGNPYVTILLREGLCFIVINKLETKSINQILAQNP